MIIVSIDSGHAAMKAVKWDGKTLVREQFQAIAEPVPEATARRVRGAIKVKNQWYAMEKYGRLVDSAKELNLNHKSFHASTSQLVQYCYAYEKLGIDGPIDLLVVTLPYDQALDDELRTRVKDMLLEVHWETLGGKQGTAKAPEIVIFPQSVGAMCMYRAITGNDDPKISMIDFGSVTLDVVSLRKFVTDSEYEYNVGASGSKRENASGMRMMTSWGSSIRDIDGLTQVTESYYDLSDRALSKNFMITAPGGLKKDLEPSYNKTRKEFTLESMNECKEIVGKDWENTDSFILTGGIVECLDLSFWECKGRTYLTSQWANTLGQLLEHCEGKNRDNLLKIIKEEETIYFLNYEGEKVVWR